MRRSSCIILALAFACLIVAGAFYLRSSNTSVPQMTNTEAARIIDKGRRALERKDVGEIMGMMAPDAKIVGRSLSEVEGFMDTAMRQVNGHLSVVSRHIEAHQNGNQANIALDMDVIQKTSRMDAVYYPNLHVTVSLERRKADRWLGLIPAEEWKITQVDTAPVIETPPP